MRQKHILLIGERRENALPLCLFLESWGFWVTVVEEGSRFADKFNREQDPLKPFDLLVTGTQMPEELLSTLLSQIESRKIGCPVIMISDNDNQAWVKEILTEYAGVYIVSPTEPEELVKMVEQIFKKNSGLESNRD
jgi:DNA-binding response OmpR family regulator